MQKEEKSFQLSLQLTLSKISSGIFLTDNSLIKQFYEETIANYWKLSLKNVLLSMLSVIYFCNPLKIALKELRKIYAVKHFFEYLRKY